MNVRESCVCRRCIGACYTRPGVFVPSEIAPIAAYLRVSARELFEQYLMVNIHDVTEADREGRVAVLAPAIVGRSGEAVERGVKGKCVFLTPENLCRLHYAGKPSECGSYFHEDLNVDAMDRHRELSNVWATSEHQAYVEQVTGRSWATELEVTC